MKRIDPKTFGGPRAYFTAFDYRILARIDNELLLRRQVERQLKLLLLIKSRVVCAASHLTSDFTYQFFRDNVELLRTGSIKPALRIDKDGITDLFEPGKRKSEQEKIKFYTDNIFEIVSWQLEENTEWFRDRFVEELTTDGSVVRKALSGLPVESIDNIASALSKTDVLSREEIGIIAEQLPEDVRPVLLNFRDLLYHISGARVVNSESSLPQENYIDYDFVDLEHGRMRLSDDQILWKLFIELALESFQRRLLPVEMLDLLTFDDILRLRQALMDSGFQDDYDRLVSTAMPQQSKASDALLLDYHQLENIRTRLEKTFKSVFEVELRDFIRGKVIGDAKELCDVTASVALGFAGLIPGLGTFASLASVLKESPALYMNIAQIHRSAKSLSGVHHYLRQRNETIKSSIQKMDIGEKSPMIDMVDMLTSTISERIKL